MSNLFGSRPRQQVERENANREKPGTGDPLHTLEPATVASFRTWRGSRENVARDRCLTIFILASDFPMNLRVAAF